MRSSVSAPRLPEAFRRRADRPAIVGHRGARGTFPENTIDAFDAAKRQGADAIELDVRPTKDGALVVFHDPDLWRLAADRRSVDQVTHRELCTRAGLAVPTLEEALAFARGVGLGVNVEIKRDVLDRRALVEDVATVIGRWDPRHDLVISSFDPWMLRAHRARCPERAHGLLVHRSAYDHVALFVARFVADGVHVHTTLAHPRVLPEVARRGFVAAWTVNDVVIARRAFDLGADALITDEPGRIRASFDPCAPLAQTANLLT